MVYNSPYAQSNLYVFFPTECSHCFPTDLPSLISNSDFLPADNYLAFQHIRSLCNERLCYESLQSMC